MARAMELMGLVGRSTKALKGGWMGMACCVQPRAGAAAGLEGLDVAGGLEGLDVTAGWRGWRPQGGWRG